MASEHFSFETNSNFLGHSRLFQFKTRSICISLAVIFYFVVSFTEENVSLYPTLELVCTVKNYLTVGCKHINQFVSF